MLETLKIIFTSNLSNYLFAALSIYTIYAVIYERLLMHPYYNNTSGESEYQLLPALLLFWEQTFAWAFVQIFAEFKLSKAEINNSKNQIPWKVSSIFGITKFIAIALFIQGIYQTNFRFAFMIRTGLFISSTLACMIYNKFTTKSSIRTTKNIVQIICSSLVLGGTILFWIYDPEICFYVPIEPRVKGALMIVGSVLIEGILGVVRVGYINKEKVNPVRMQRDMGFWIMFISYFYLLSKGSFTEDFKYAFKHLEYLTEVLAVGFLYFLSQLIEFKSSQAIPSSSGYLTSSGMFLTVLISYTFSVHKFYQYQILGLVMAVIGFIGGLVVLGKPQETQMIEEDKVFKPYQMVSDLELQE